MERSGRREFVFFLICVAAFIAAGWIFHIDLEESRRFFSQYPLMWSGMIFVVLYVVGTFFIWFGPKDVLRVASLFLFGVMTSSVLIYIGEMLNMVALFWFSRTMGRPFIEQRSGQRFKNIERAVSQTSAPVIFFLKFYPVVSLRLLDLGYGLTTISFLKYALISLIAAPLRLYIVQYFLNLMIVFGLALNGNLDTYTDRFMDMTYYLMDRPVLFLCLTVYVMSCLIFFTTLFLRWRLRKK